MKLALVILAACSHQSVATQPVTAPPAVTVLHSFTSDEGTDQRAAVTLGPDGKLWGSTWQRGPNRVDPDATHSCSSTGAWSTDYQGRMCPGSVWRMNSDGSGLEVVHAFSTLDAAYRNADGYQPSSTPIDGGDGGTWGTATKGGAQTLSTGRGGGVVYRIDVATLAFETVHAFPSLPLQLDGAYLYGGLARDDRGHLFGSAKAGGSGSAGTVFDLDLATHEVTPLHSYAPVTYVRSPTGAITSQTNVDGGNPFGAPVIGWDGRLHAWVGSWGPQQGGALLGFALDGSESIDHVFAQQPVVVNADNAAMQTLTVSGRDGRIFGTRPLAGVNGTGVVFRTERDGSGYTELFTFDAAPVYGPTGHYANATGAVPLGTLYEDLDGTFVGTCLYGGPAGLGIVWRINRDGTGFRVLAELDHTTGCYPAAGVTRVGAALVGTTTMCGPTNGGTIYRVGVP